MRNSGIYKKYDLNLGNGYNDFHDIYFAGVLGTINY